MKASKGMSALWDDLVLRASLLLLVHEQVPRLLVAVDLEEWKWLSVRLLVPHLRFQTGKAPNPCGIPWNKLTEMRTEQTQCPGV
jgi:hypothetical protein